MKFGFSSLSSKESIRKDGEESLSIRNQQRFGDYSRKNKNESNLNMNSSSINNSMFKQYYFINENKLKFNQEKFKNEKAKKLTNKLLLKKYNEKLNKLNNTTKHNEEKERETSNKNNISSCNILGVLKKKNLIFKISNNLFKEEETKNSKTARNIKEKKLLLPKLINHSTLSIIPEKISKISHLEKGKEKEKTTLSRTLLSLSNSKSKVSKEIIIDNVSEIDLVEGRSSKRSKNSIEEKRNVNSLSSSSNDSDDEVGESVDSLNSNSNYFKKKDESLTNSLNKSLKPTSPTKTNKKELFKKFSKIIESNSLIFNEKLNKNYEYSTVQFKKLSIKRVNEVKKN